MTDHMKGFTIFIAALTIDLYEGGEGYNLSIIYVCTQGSELHLKDNQFIVLKQDQCLVSYPIEPVEQIELFGNIAVTTPVINLCMKKGIIIAFYSHSGFYNGRFEPLSSKNVIRQKLQVRTSDNDSFCVKLSQNIISAKIHNQMVLLRRYFRSEDIHDREKLQKMTWLQKKAANGASIEKIRGYEGTAAGIYFNTLGSLVKEDFRFSKRTRRPPTDAANCLLSFGYTILLNEIIGKLSERGLNPNVGVLHSDYHNRPSLACDLIEEWRPVIVDPVVMSMINGNELRSEDFYQKKGSPAVYMTDPGRRRFIEKLEMRMMTEMKYLKSMNKEVTFRHAIAIQVSKFIKAIENQNADYYEPVMIR